KATWVDADDPTGPETSAGEPVWFRFDVTNTGDLRLRNLSLSDSDFSTSSCSIPAELAPGGSFSCELGPFSALQGQHVNTATVTATADRGIPDHTYPGVKHRFTFILADGQVIDGSSESNEAAVGLSKPIHVSCSDDFGFEDPNDDKPDGWGEKGAPVQGVDPGPIVAYRITKFKSDGKVDQVCGTQATTVTDSDRAHYLVPIPQPDIDVEKFVSVDGKATWLDADDPTGPETTQGADVFFRFEVTNTGEKTLNALTLTDTDFNLSSCAVPPSLAPGASFDCEIGPLAARLGQHENTATATGKADAGIGVHTYPGVKHRYTFVLADGQIIDGSSASNEAQAGLSDTIHVSCSDDFGFEDPNDDKPDGWGEKGAPVMGIDPGPIVAYRITKFKSDGKVETVCG
ncbi:MAG: hypothetical protein R3246_15760, partial [Acidimicrobiia bacterium]|nr:hypothetical protein [Acidimicrobiia bacterium]